MCSMKYPFSIDDGLLLVCCLKIFAFCSNLFILSGKLSSDADFLRDKMLKSFSLNVLSNETLDARIDADGSVGHFFINLKQSYFDSVLLKIIV